ncbi:hypothetical protein Salat_1743500 [Sesamum alatum]|uniref:Uncharacterized protein n=1 Tax=Sesamum alatum TaxID=300844 RepID=A0AAE2CKH3_9LAMI|nr:hypothetical protein Salat_1743500 [Sesamum alatum]
MAALEGSDVSTAADNPSPEETNGDPLEKLRREFNFRYFCNLASRVVDKGFKVKHKEAAKNAQEESNERFDLLQKEIEKLKQTNMELQGQQRVILKVVEKCLPDSISQMLQDI